MLMLIKATYMSNIQLSEQFTKQSYLAEILDFQISFPSPHDTASIAHYLNQCCCTFYLWGGGRINLGEDR